MSGWRAFLVSVACTSLLVSGGSADAAAAAAAAGQVAEAFSEAVAARPDAACELLAPETRQELESSSGPCAQGIAEAKLPQAGRVLGVQVFGLDAMVRLEHDTMFMAMFDSGW